MLQHALVAGVHVVSQFSLLHVRRKNLSAHWALRLRFLGSLWRRTVRHLLRFDSDTCRLWIFANFHVESRDSWRQFCQLSLQSGSAIRESGQVDAPHHVLKRNKYMYNQITLQLWVCEKNEIIKIPVIPFDFQAASQATSSLWRKWQDFGRLKREILLNFNKQCLPGNRLLPPEFGLTDFGFATSSKKLSFSLVYDLKLFLQIKFEVNQVSAAVVLSRFLLASKLSAVNLRRNSHLRDCYSSTRSTCSRPMTSPRQPASSLLVVV